MASLVYGQVLVVAGLVLPCLPAPAPAQAELFYVFLLLVSLSQICIFAYHVILLTNQGEMVAADRLVYLNVISLFIIGFLDKKLMVIKINISESTDLICCGT